jgi:hypothetical protein
MTNRKKIEKFCEDNNLKISKLYYERRCNCPGWRLDIDFENFKMYFSENPYSYSSTRLDEMLNMANYFNNY